ncbi:MAG TPA: dTDP-glucose 4,6-dehydratase [Methanomassiliicoccales archaeon]|nr:dTDP-glucose 4,6-dehydratase [Methanomassiliicoccales archaeon]
MKLLVTGGAGFIGANYIRSNINGNNDIVCLDLLTYAGNLDNLDGVIGKDNFTFVRGDINDRSFVRDLFKKEHFDRVVHFAAESHVDRSIEDPSSFLRTNVLGTQNLLDACREFGIERFHQVSTDEVYGDLPLERKDLKFTEEYPIVPSSPYSASKASADLLCHAYYRTFNVPITISRCSNNYGPYQFPEKLIPRMIVLALRNEKLPVYGKGENVRDWLHVSDHCSAIDAILSKGKVGEVYNIGGNCERRNIDIVKLILRQLGKPEDLISFVKDRKGHDLRYAIDNGKISRELGWSPAVRFEKGMRDTIDWYLSNETWLKRIESGEYRAD